MKHILIILSIIFLISGCSHIYKKSNQEAFDKIINSDNGKINIFRRCTLEGDSLEHQPGQGLDTRIFLNGQEIEVVNTCQLVSLENLNLKDENILEVKFSKSQEFLSKFSRYTNPAYKKILPYSWKGDLVKRVGDNVAKGTVKCKLIDCDGVNYTKNVVEFSNTGKEKDKFFIISIMYGATDIEVKQYNKEEFISRYKYSTKPSIRKSKEVDVR